MSEVRHRPAFFILIPFMAGILIGARIEPGFDISFLVFLISSFFLIVTLFFSMDRLFTIVAVVVLLLLGVVRMKLDHDLIAGQDVRHFANPDRHVCLQGLICGPVEADSLRLMFDLKVDSVFITDRGQSACGRVRCVLHNASLALQYGDRIFIKGVLEKPSAARNPGSFDYRKYLASKNIHSILRCPIETWVLILGREQGPFLRQKIIYPIREFIISTIDRTRSGQKTALLKGLLLGETSEIEDDLRQAFAEVGAIHILAVSGLHVGYIVIGLIFILRTIRIPKRFFPLLVIFGLYIYTELTGLRTPVVRASVMAAVILMVPLFQRFHDPINTLSLAAVIILLISPLQLFTVGFQLSFAAVLGILLIYRKLIPLMGDSQNKIKIYLWGITSVSIAAQLAVLPLIAYYFGMIPTISLAANFLVVPMAGFIIAAGFVALTGACIWMPVGSLLLQITNWLLSALIFCVKGLAAFPYSHLQVAQPPVSYIIIFYLILALVISWHHAKMRKIVLLVILVVCNILIWYRIFIFQPCLRITFFDVGQGDSALFEFPDGRTLLVDTGMADEFLDAGEKIILPYLRRSGIRQIDLLAVSHAHADHAGGVLFLLKTFPVRRIALADIPSETGYEQEIDSPASVSQIPVVRVSSGDTLAGFSNTTLLILNPDFNHETASIEEPDDLNNGSIVMKIIYGRTSILMCGDAELEAETEMLRYGPSLKVDLVKVGHHGSRSSSSETFCNRVNPLFALISVGARNRFNMPDELVLERWRRTGAEILRTDFYGALVFVSNGYYIKRDEGIWLK